MSALSKVAPAAAFDHSVEPFRQNKPFWSYPEGINYLSKKFLNDETVRKMNTTILRYTQPTSMTPMQDADVLYANSCKVPDAYDESTLNVIFFEGVHTYTCLSLREYR